MTNEQLWVHLLSRGIHCTEFDIFLAKGQIYIERTTYNKFVYAGKLVLNEGNILKIRDIAIILIPGGVITNGVWQLMREIERIVEKILKANTHDD